MGGVLEELVADRVPQLVVVVLEVAGVAPANAAAFKADHMQAGLRQLMGDDAADPADPDDDDVDLLQRHGYFPPLYGAFGSGLCSYGYAFAVKIHFAY
jgi:hypothetical protein